MEVSVSDKGVLLFNQALIHMRVSVLATHACIFSKIMHMLHALVLSYTIIPTMYFLTSLVFYLHCSFTKMLKPLKFLSNCIKFTAF